EGHRWIRSIDIGFEGDIQTDVHNNLLTRELEFTPVQFNSHSGGQLQFRVTPQYERLEEDFEISDGVVLPAGGIYEFTRYQVEVETPEHFVVAVSPEGTWGELFPGRRPDMTMRVDGRPRRGVSLSAEAERSFLDLAEGSFNADVYRVDASTQ